MNQFHAQIKHVINHNGFSGKVYIFDFDGTLSDGTHRLDKLPTTDLHLTESWREFNELAIYDKPIESTIQVMNAIFKAGGFVIILTGRSDETVEKSLEWLYLEDAKFNALVMREASDNRKDIVIKEEFLRYIGLQNVVAAWDDSPKVIEHFRSLGITTYQVCDYGDKTHAHIQSHGV